MAHTQKVELVLALGLLAGGVWGLVLGGAAFALVSFVPAVLVGALAWLVPSRDPARPLFAAALNLAIGWCHMASVMGVLVYWPLWLVGIAGFFLAVWPNSARSLVAALFGTIFLAASAVAVTSALYEPLLAQNRGKVVPIEARELIVAIAVGALGAACLAFAHPSGPDGPTSQGRYRAFIAAFSTVPLTAVVYVVLVRLGLPLSA